ncbi:MAG: class I tRNA ligase family protein, partial [Myxococcales bacterium]|nr:class I tRNA ligase family protein [Myxococcales bacterium]
RMYEMFMGPLEAVKPWQTSQIQGVVRFRDRLFKAVTRGVVDGIDAKTEKLVHKTIKKVTEDIDAMRFNTAIAAMMELTNHVVGLPETPRAAAEALTLLVSPFAPHLGEELHKRLGHEGSLAYAPWPSFDAKLCVDDTVSMGVQVNGKTRGTVEIPKDADEATAKAAALAVPSVKAHVEGKDLKKFIFVPGRIINFVVK